MMGRDISISAPDGAFGAYLVPPSTGSGPGIIVIQEIFGVNGSVRAMADDFAARGFFALAPDLYWRLEPNTRLTDKTDAERKHALDLKSKFSVDAAVEDIQIAITHLRRVPGCAARVGTIGHCLGGLLAFLSSTRTDTDASAGYYGADIDRAIGEAKNIRHPLLLHFAAVDEYVPPAAQKQIADGLSGNAHVTTYIYPNMVHAFARTSGAHYDQANAELANSRTAMFFRRHLS